MVFTGSALKLFSNSSVVLSTFEAIIGHQDDMTFSLGGWGSLSFIHSLMNPNFLPISIHKWSWVVKNNHPKGMILNLKHKNKQEQNNKTANKSPPLLHEQKTRNTTFLSANFQLKVKFSPRHHLTEFTPGAKAWWYLTMWPTLNDSLCLTTQS